MLESKVKSIKSLVGRRNLGRVKEIGNLKVKEIQKLYGEGRSRKHFEPILRRLSEPVLFQAYKNGLRKLMSYVFVNVFPHTAYNFYHV